VAGLIVFYSSVVVGLFAIAVASTSWGKTRLRFEAPVEAEHVDGYGTILGEEVLQLKRTQRARERTLTGQPHVWRRDGLDVLVLSQHTP
jgi:hypothetical protein